MSNDNVSNLIQPGYFNDQLDRTCALHDRPKGQFRIPRPREFDVSCQLDVPKSLPLRQRVRVPAADMRASPFNKDLEDRR